MFVHVCVCVWMYVRGVCVCVCAICEHSRVCCSSPGKCLHECERGSAGGAGMRGGERVTRSEAFCQPKSRRRWCEKEQGRER